MKYKTTDVMLCLRSVSLKIITSTSVDCLWSSEQAGKTDITVRTMHIFVSHVSCMTCLIWFV